jgi:oligosaccharide repeat unit polymerase
MVVIISLFLIICIITAYYKNRDLFSPVKFYFIALITYFFDIFLNPQLDEVYFSYFLYLVVGLILIFIEAKMLVNFHSVIEKFQKRKLPVLHNPIKIFSTILLISIIPIAAQLYLISLMGGIELYFISMKLRVEAWLGLGHIIIFRDLMSIVNLFYFILLICFDFKHKKVFVFLYIVHFMLTIGIGMLSGSRSGILNTFLLNLMIFHYMIKRIKPIFLIPFFIFFLIGASFLEDVREQFRINDIEGVKLVNENSELSETLSNTSTFVYGIIPLNIIYQEKFTSLQYGLTYLTTFSNYIPRNIWPGKPDTGGVIITKFKKKGSYEGTTNYSPGLIVEGIINFGYILGPFIAFLFLFLVSNLVFIRYRNLARYLQKHIQTNFLFINHNIIIRSFFLLVLVQQIIGNLTVAESNNIGFNLIKQLLFFTFIDFIILRLIRLSYTNNCQKNQMQ